MAVYQLAISLLVNLVLSRLPGGPEGGGLFTKWQCQRCHRCQPCQRCQRWQHDILCLCQLQWFWHSLFEKKKTSAFQLCLQSEVCFDPKTKGCMSNKSFFLQSKSASWKMSTFSRRSGSAGYDLVMMMMMMLKKVVYQICHSCVCSLLHLATFILYDKSNLRYIIWY